MESRGLLSALALGAAIRALAGVSLLQPGVKEYRPGNGEADFSQAVVVHQNQEQCRIGANEIPSAGRKSAYAGGELPASGVFVALAGSELGAKLAGAFRLDVPKKPQGYAICIDGSRAAIVGSDPEGALYGAVTFRQLMADGGRVSSAAIRDWPDILERGGVSIGRGLWPQTKGKEGAARVEELKRTIDELMRHKINGITDIFRAWADSPSYEIYREALVYARKRGIRTVFNAPGGTGIWTNHNCPKGMTPAKWPCVAGVRGWGDIYYCWSDDKAIEAAAERCIEYLNRFGLEDPVVYIHPVDWCSVDDPEEWSRRCPKCRARWKDDERWKASANIFNIWRRTFDRSLPKASFVAPVVPYSISLLSKPEEKRSARWRQNVTEYWAKLDAALEDKDMAFESWIAPKGELAQYRRLLPRRRVRFTDTYPMNPGLFLTCRRRIGSMHESGGGTGYGMTGTDANAYWESCLLAAEYGWNVRAPGWEEYDGRLYWHPVDDTTGPEIVMTNLLPRICRTFWGKDLAGHMCKVMSSGVLPRYLENPAGSVRTWNRILQDANFDPEQAREISAGREVFSDSLEFRRRQLAAAELCERVFADARSLAGGLEHFKRRYFESLAGSASRWCDLARSLVARSEIDMAIESGDAAKARALASAVAKNVCIPEIRNRYESLACVLDAKPGDSAVPPKKGRAGSAVCGKGWRNAEVWTGERVIDRPMVVNRRNIHVAPGSRIVFKGEGKLYVEHGQFRAEGASFVGVGVLTNSWRISVSGDRAEFANCRFEGLVTHNPGGQRWFRGAVRLMSSSVRLAGCRFERTQSPILVNCRQSEICDNVFACTDNGLYLLNVPNARVERNVFSGAHGGKRAIELGGAMHAEIVHNRFDGFSLGIFARTGSSYCIAAGNVLENCARAYSVVGSKGFLAVPPIKKP